MEKRITERYKDEILHTAMQCYDIAEGKIQPLGGFESYIYAFERDGRDYILRIAHSIRRSENLIQGEVDWINYLAAGGASVVKAVLSAEGNLVESLDDDQGGAFLTTAFEKARGAPPGKETLTDDFFCHYGQVIGKMHALTKNYCPSHSSWTRLAWDAPGNLDIAGWIPSSETRVLEKSQQLKSYLNALPISSDAYGLIHQDAHAGNFFIDKNDHITLFDFDDSVYGWFIYDIAVVLFYASMWGQDAAAFTSRFMPPFLKGYREENQLGPAWLKEIPNFLKLREIDLYAVIHRSFDLENLDPWCTHYMNGRKEKIENAVPFIRYDWETLSTNI
jgi:Ser/Thr protein kinase RdoA (MazF antagonist)